ncbi:TPA: hypothetical protein ACVOY7_004524, partial [Vibrio alginolyticus]
NIENGRKIKLNDKISFDIKSVQIINTRINTRKEKSSPSISTLSASFSSFAIGRAMSILKQAIVPTNKRTELKREKSLNCSGEYSLVSRGRAKIRTP